MNFLSVVIIAATIIGRLLSGVQWVTDIIGGILIGVALLMTLYSVINVIKNEK